MCVCDDEDSDYYYLFTLAQVADIAKMQTVIAQHLSSQAEMIDNIYTTTVEATDYMVAGNEQLEQSKKSLSSAAWNIFLFINMCTFCLWLFHFIA